MDVIRETKPVPTEPIPDIRRIWLVDTGLVDDINNPSLTQFGLEVAGDLLGFLVRDYPDAILETADRIG